MQNISTYIWIGWISHFFRHNLPSKHKFTNTLSSNRNAIFQVIFHLGLSRSSFGWINSVSVLAQSDNEEVDGHGLYYYNEGGVINYYFVSNNTDASSASIVTYDDETQEFYHQASPQVKYVVTNTNSIFQLSGQGEPLKAPISEDGEVYFGSAVKLYVAKDYGDPKGYLSIIMVFLPELWRIVLPSVL